MGKFLPASTIFLFFILIIPSITFAGTVFDQNLSPGMTRPEVQTLQEFLNRLGFTVAQTGSGSPGDETTKFGVETTAALKKFQKSYNIVPAAGYFGPLTRAVANTIYNKSPSLFKNHIATSSTLVTMSDLESEIKALRAEIASIANQTANNFNAISITNRGFSNGSISGDSISDSTISGGSIANTHLTGTTTVDNMVSTGNVTNPSMANSLWYGTSTGSVIPLSLGTTLSIANGTLNASTSVTGVINYIATASSSVPRTLTSKLGDIVSVKDFGAKGDGITNDTAAIQAAINAAGSYASIFFPTGTYLVTSGLTITNDRVVLYGTGKYSSRIEFEPTVSNTVLFTFRSAGGGIIWQDALRDIGIESEGNTLSKTAVKIVDSSGFYMHNVVIYPFASTGNDAIGIWLQGRETGTFSKIDSWADLPLWIDKNPDTATSTLDLDQTHFSDMYLSANDAQPVIKVTDGVQLTNVTFDGYEEWAGGNDGFYWNDTTSNAISYGLSFNNVRWEQGSGGWMFYLNHHTGIQNLSFNNITNNSASGTNGFYLRNVNGVSFDNVDYQGSTGTALDAASATDGNIHFSNTTFHAGSSVLLNGASAIDGGYTTYNANINYPASSYYSIPNTLDLSLNPSINSTVPINQIDAPILTLTASSTAAVGGPAMGGLLLVTDESTWASGIIMLKNTMQPAIVSDIYSFFGTVKDTPNKYNIYWDPNMNRIMVQNNRTPVAKLIFTLIGQGEHYPAP